MVGGGGGTVIITSAPGPGLCHSQRFFERFFGDSLRDSLEMDLVRSLTKTNREMAYSLSVNIVFSFVMLVPLWYSGNQLYFGIVKTN